MMWSKRSNRPVHLVSGRALCAFVSPMVRMLSKHPQSQLCLQLCSQLCPKKIHCACFNEFSDTVRKEDCSSKLKKETGCFGIGSTISFQNPELPSSERTLQEYVHFAVYSITVRLIILYSNHETAPKKAKLTLSTAPIYIFFYKFPNSR